MRKARSCCCSLSTLPVSSTVFSSSDCRLSCPHKLQSQLDQNGFSAGSLRSVKPDLSFMLGFYGCGFKRDFWETNRIQEKTRACRRRDHLADHIASHRDQTSPNVDRVC